MVTPCNSHHRTASQLRSLSTGLLLSHPRYVWGKLGKMSNLPSCGIAWHCGIIYLYLSITGWSNSEKLPRKNSEHETTRFSGVCLAQLPRILISCKSPSGETHCSTTKHMHPWVFKCLNELKTYRTRDVTM